MMGGSVAVLIVVLAWRYLGNGSTKSLGPDAHATRIPWYFWLIGVVVILLGSALIWLSIRSIRAQRAKQHQAEIDQAVAIGPSVALLPRSDARPVQVDKINLWERLADALPHDEHISFELGGNEEGIGFVLHGSENGVRAALTQVRSEWPGVQQRPIEQPDDPTQLPEGWHLWWCECTPSTWDKSITALSDDPLRAILFELKGVMGQGRGLLQVIARNDFGTRRALGERAFASRSAPPDNPGVRALRTREASALETRAQRTFLQATIRTVGMADTPERAQGIARGLGRAVAASFGHSNPVRVVVEGQDLHPVTTRQMGQRGAWGGNELAYLAHLTGSDMLSVAPRLKAASARSLPADPAMRVVAADWIAAFLEKETPGEVSSGA